MSNTFHKLAIVSAAALLYETSTLLDLNQGELS